jgi:hypothetical protein
VFRLKHAGIGWIAVMVLTACGRSPSDKVAVTGADCPSPEQLVKGVMLTCHGTQIAGTAALTTYVPCSADGQSGCIATSQFKAADTSAVHADDIRQGVTIAGVAGTMAQSAPSTPACVIDGDTNCKVSGNLVAADTTGAAKKIVAGEILAGLSGEGVLNPAADCASNAQVGCLATNAFQALEADKMAQCLQLP